MRAVLQSENAKGRDQLEETGKTKNNIKMVLKEIGWKGVDWIHLA
jgi:hypothetical protein